jgi:predicted transcriptional regulator containing an HTH domain and an uncharacterized domain shared with the mammalian protein schlafen
MARIKKLNIRENSLNIAIFVDRREFTGTIQNQIEEAYKYVLSKINLGAEIEGLYRQDMYELPIGSIREIIANAVTHRSYLEPGNVQVALYDNRLEVTSPGMLLNGVTIEKIKEGYSKVRNRAIANAFSYMRIIEEWGSGIPRMFDEFSKYGLAEPELVDMDGDFRVNFYRSSVTPRVTEKVTEKFTEREMSVIRLIKNNPRITTTAMSMKLGKSRKTISAIIKSLKDRNVIEREGSDRNGIWIIK